jgi:3-oxoacyl-[acyl-carrier protein] reductase
MTKEAARRVAVVTGAARGFGQAISVGLARRGIDIVAVDLEASDETISLVQAENARAVGLIADVSDPASAMHLTTVLESHFGRCDILVNNAGIYPNKPIAETDYALWQRVMRVNLDSAFLMTKAVLPLMIEGKWGRIVNIASDSVGLVVTGLVPYIASKAGMIGFTRALASDVADHGITVNAIGPTATLTPGGRVQMAPELVERLAQTQAIKRPGTAEDIVGVVAFLSSDDSAFVTGQTIMADGGLVRL